MERNIEQKLDNVRGRISDMIGSDRLDSVREYAGHSIKRTEDLVRKYPLYSVLGAAVVGLAIGRILSSRAENLIYEQ
jgi:ElaB/YqjD/DUF883 family membrane-anchored ribosome-binding protein